MKLAWLTDIHINFLDRDIRTIFNHEIKESGCDAVLISGDIAEAPSFPPLLTEMAEHVKKPIYFVLGNHDYYRSDVTTVHNAALLLSQAHELLFWLPANIHALDADTVLVGQDGWADGRYGDYLNSPVVLNDSRMIADLLEAKKIGKKALLEKMQQLSDQDAMNLQKDLALALQKQPKKIIILTHIPPFKEACRHKGELADDYWLPFLASKALGDVIQTFAAATPQTTFLVLSGHTHGTAHYQPLPNLINKVGKAEYYLPEIQEIITL